MGAEDVKNQGVSEIVVRDGRLVRDGGLWCSGQAGAQRGMPCQGPVVWQCANMGEFPDDGGKDWRRWWDGRVRVRCIRLRQDSFDLRAKSMACALEHGMNNGEAIVGISTDQCM